MIYFKLFYEFLITGVFAFGGGLATLPFLNEMGISTGWFTTEELTNMLAVAESTPGPIGINMATYVGFKVAGVGGAAVATIALILPSLILVLILIKVLNKFSENPYVIGTLYGLRPASVGLVTVAAIYVMEVTFFKEAIAFSNFNISIINLKAILLFVIVFILGVLIKKTKKIHPIIFIAVSAIIGIIFQFSK